MIHSREVLHIRKTLQKAILSQWYYTRSGSVALMYSIDENSPAIASEVQVRLTRVLEASEMVHSVEPNWTSLRVTGSL